MQIERPDLSLLEPGVREYIEYLEDELHKLKDSRTRSTIESEPLPPLEPSEPPTTLNVITLTARGIAKRTPRHLYTRQHRGGMGVFDLITPKDEPPALLAIADQDQSLLLFTNLARAFRIAVQSIREGEVNVRGESITERLGLMEGEFIAAALPDLVKGNVAMVSDQGMVRSLRHHVFGDYMKPGTTLFDAHKFGPLAAACWTPGDSDLFIATRQGRAIRFSEKLVPPQGGPGIKVDGGDRAISITAVYEDSGVFLLTEDGKGTIRKMEGFNPNKSSGGSGKNAMATSSLVGAAVVNEDDDLFAITLLSKIIRFRAAEVPAKEGVVQGVNCMTLRADHVEAMTVAAIST
jgi:DNA gyrase subunit A